MKKAVYITLGVIATTGLGYFIYTKIRDRNKEIVQDGGFTIKVSADATTTNTDGYNSYGSIYGSNSYTPLTTPYQYDYNSSSEPIDEPAWSETDYTTTYGSYGYSYGN